MRNIKGFTLIEIMVVIVILAVLAAIAIPSYQNYVIQSKIKEAQSNLIALSLSSENFYQRTLSYPTATLSNTSMLKANDVFKTWNPTSAAFSYAYNSADGAEYTFTATGLDSRLSHCTLSLNDQGVRSISGCGTTTEWVN